MATGDLKRSLRNLEQVLRSVNYPQEVDCVGLVKGDLAASLPIISYSLTSYSPYVAELLMESNVELIAKNDLRFIDTVYKLLRDQFNYKPILTKKQFLQCGFAEWKIQIICDILNCVIKKHKELSGLDKKAVVIRHLYNEDGVSISDSTSSAMTDVNEAFAVSDLKDTEIQIPEVKVPEIESEQQDIKVNTELIELKTLLAECQEKLKKLTQMESKLDSLEEKMKGKVMVDEKTWTNLISRVTLLETELLLSKKNDDYINYDETNEDYASGSSSRNILKLDSKSKEKQSKSKEKLAIPLSSCYRTVSRDTTPRTSTLNYCGLKEISEETTIQKMEKMKKMFEETAELLKSSNHSL
ncbi:centrosomal protein of 44 kDa isoform X7 [Pipistrellus kuhlii]|uniref:centrosomal protein of 44 kDa isoform X7 n=1 Tax=Pipistrellus kuhlii TaxID=59472 RepID=UPI001E2702F4|nr:centrosomal protein of 44 kDa isoform X7 [Pipistrellus kuhlii]